MTRQEIVWEEPPVVEKGHNQGKGFWQGVTTTLKDHPNQWAVVREYDDPEKAYRAATQGRRRFPGFEFTARTDYEGRAKVYCRYIGENGHSA